jgi:hypothetical protein
MSRPNPGVELEEKAMKSLIFAAALLAAGSAVAQTMPEPAPGAGTTTSAPANSAPERDSRGIPVVSDPADVPAGFNQPAQVGGTGVSPEARPAPQPATEAYRPCSRTVTDNCVQAYERGARRPR